MYDVAVIGYGPVGMMTAALLGRLGRSVIVLERYSSLYNLPRAAIFDDETMRTFARLGIQGELLRTVHAQRNYEWRNGAGELLIEHSFAETGKEGWAEWYMMYQPHLEEILSGYVASLPGVTVQMSAPVVSVEELAGSVRLELAGGHSPVEARYVVACDGGNSFIRASLGIDQFDYGFSEPWMVCDFRLLRPSDVPKARQVCDPDQPISVISLGPSHHRFSFMLDSAESFAAEAEPERVWRRVQAYLGREDAELIRVATYTFRSLVADTWRVGRIILAGDAAHQMPPFLGQGMCSGIRDAQNLAYKLQFVLDGADAALLDTFQSEREPHVRRVIEKGIELGRVQTMRDHTAAAERDRRLIAQRKRSEAPEKMRFPGLGPGMHMGGANGGQLMPQGRVRTGLKEDRFDQVVGAGFVLLFDQRRLEAGQLLLDEDAAALAVHTGITVTTVGGQDAELVDCDGTYADWFNATQCAAVLWRPDFYIFGTAEVPEQASDLVRQLAGAVLPSPATV